MTIVSKHSIVELRLKFLLLMPVPPWFEVCAQRHSSCFGGTRVPLGFPGGVVVRNTPAIAVDIRDAGSLPSREDSLEGGHGQLTQYSCLENSMGRGTVRATAHGVAKKRTGQQLSTHEYHCYARVPLLWVTLLLPLLRCFSYGV